MATQPNTEIAQLRQQMASMQPGVIENATENAAPFITKLLGYTELVRALLPRLLAARDAARDPAPAVPALPAAPAAWRGRGIGRRARSWSWRARILAVVLPVSAGLAAYGVWRLRSVPRFRRGVPMG